MGARFAASHLTLPPSGTDAMFSTVARFAVALMLLTPAIAVAQNAERQGVPERQTLSLDGVLQGAQQGLLQVVSDGGEPWLIKVEARPDAILYQAAADPGWLQPGMYVQFKGTFNKHGKSTAPLTEVTVFTPNETTSLGAFPDRGAEAAGDQLFAETRPEPKVKPKPVQPETLSLNIAGRVAGVEQGKIRVAAGDAVVEAELDEKTAVSVDLNNIVLARPGDKISVNGWYVQKGQGLANRLLVRAAQPLTKPKKERVIVSPEDRKKALDALDDLSAGDAGGRDAKAPQDEDKDESPKTPAPKDE
jgi:hypothetical protein